MTALLAYFTGLPVTVWLGLAGVAALLFVIRWAYKRGRDYERVRYLEGERRTREQNDETIRDALAARRAADAGGLYEDDGFKRD